MSPRLPLGRFKVLNTKSPDVALDSIRRRQPGAKNLEAIWGPDWHLVTNALQLGAVTIVASRSGGYTIGIEPDRHVRICLPIFGHLSLRTLRAEMDELGSTDGFVTSYSGGRMLFRPKSGVILVTAEVGPMADAMRLFDCEADPALLADRVAGTIPEGGIADYRQVVLNVLDEVEHIPPKLLGLKRFQQAKGEILLLHTAEFLSRFVKREAEQAGPLSRIMRRSLEYIESVLAEDFSYADLAAYVGTSLRTVQLAFRRELNSTISDYVRQRRLVTAKMMLMEDDQAHSVAWVAETVGYYHLGRFAADYRRAFGETPSETLRHRRNQGSKSKSE